MADQKNAMPDPRWQAAFERFCETGESEKPFLDYLDGDPEAQAIVEAVFSAETRSLSGLAAALQQEESSAVRRAAASTMPRWSVFVTGLVAAIASFLAIRTGVVARQAEHRWRALQLQQDEVERRYEAASRELAASRGSVRGLQEQLQMASASIGGHGELNGVLWSTKLRAKKAEEREAQLRATMRTYEAHLAQAVTLAAGRNKMTEEQLVSCRRQLANANSEIVQQRRAQTQLEEEIAQQRRAQARLEEKTSTLERHFNFLVADDNGTFYNGAALSASAKAAGIDDFKPAEWSISSSEPIQANAMVHHFPFRVRTISIDAKTDASGRVVAHSITNGEIFGIDEGELLKRITIKPARLGDTALATTMKIDVPVTVTDAPRRQ